MPSPPFRASIWAASPALWLCKRGVPPVHGYHLRHLPFVTIDGEDARDFDDAVYCEKNASGWKLFSGGWKLYVAIADVFDALTSTRPYKQPWSTEDAVAHIQSQAGKHFEPRLVDLFVALLPQLLPIQAQWAD